MSRQYCRGRRHASLREKTIAKLMLIMIINVVAIIEVLDIIMMLIYGMIIETTKFLALAIETPMTSSWLLRDKILTTDYRDPHDVIMVVKRYNKGVV